MKKRRPETVFVTGGAGFIGSNFLNKYVPLRPDRLFVNIDCLTYAGDLSNVIVDSAANYVFEKVNIRNRNKLEKLFKKYRPTGVINFAAESHVDLSIKNPSVFLDTNVIGTHNLLLFARELGVVRFHQVSTDEVYGSHTNLQDIFFEYSPLVPRNPYSASKAGADEMVRAYQETFELSTVVTRSCNVYGPRQDRSKMIPSFITKLLRGEKVPLYSRGEHRREWLYVDDCIDAIHRVFEGGRSSEIYNISSEYELTNLELTKKLLALTGRDESHIDYVRDRLGHDFRYSMNSDKIRKELNWRPRTSFDKGLQKTLEYYRQ